MSSNSSNGFSTFEVLIGLLLSAPILGVLALSIHNAIIWRAKFTLDISEKRLIQRIESIINDGLDAIDHSAIDLPPRIHSLGTLTLTDGTPNAVMHSSGPNKPSTSSQAITFAKPLSIEAQRVIRSDNSGVIAFYQSCPIYPLPPKKPFSEYHSFLLLKPEGIYEAELNSQFWKLDDQGLSCWNSSAVELKSMLAISSDTQSDLTNVRMLIPIEELYTLYIDKRQQLRYLHHRGDTNIENQPLLKGIESLRFTSLPLGRAMIIKTEIHFPNGHSATIFSANHIARSSYINLLMNS